VREREGEGKISNYWDFRFWFVSWRTNGIM